MPKDLIRMNRFLPHAKLLFHGIWVVFLGGGLLRAEGENWIEFNPVDIGSRLELFVDELLVDSMDRVSSRPIWGGLSRSWKLLILSVWY